jgi:hypothetical protein
LVLVWRKTTARRQLIDKFVEMLRATEIALRQGERNMPRITAL